MSTLKSMGVAYELVFVDDGSRDGGWDAIEEIALRDPCVVALKLSRNFGQHPAITAGLSTAAGDWIVVMDCDLQHPPEAIPRLYETALSGYDIVFTRRRGGGQTWFRRTTSRLYFRLMNAVMKTRIDTDFSNFSIIARPVRDAFLRIRDKDRQYLMILHWLGFRHTTVDFEHADRYAGRSTYTLTALVKFALAGLFFQTATLLRWIIYAGFAISAAGAGLAAFLVYNYFFGHPYAGWTSLAVLLLFLGGFILVSTGVTGLYIGQIFIQVKDRPLYVVQHAIAEGRQVGMSDVSELHDDVGARTGITRVP